MRTSIVLVQLLMTASSAQAEPTCAAAETRIGFLAGRLDADARIGTRHRWGWLAAYASAVAGQVVLASLSNDRGERAELYVGAGKAFLGIVPLIFDPIPAIADAPRLHARISDTDDRCQVAADAERYLDRSAHDEAFARGWLAHASTIAVNGGGLLIVGLGYHRWTTTTIGAIVGVAIGELEIWTRPSGALCAVTEDTARWTVTPSLSPAGGASLVLTSEF